MKRPDDIVTHQQASSMSRATDALEARVAALEEKVEELEVRLNSRLPIDPCHDIRIQISQIQNALGIASRINEPRQ